MARKKPKWQWVRFNSTTTAPASPHTIDLLADYRTQFGILMNQQDVTLWRMFIQYSAVLNVGALQADMGISCSVFNESIVSGAPNALTQQYTERFLLWDYLYVVEEIFQGGVITTPVVYRRWDIRAHRKLQNQDETFFFQAVTQGGVTSIASDSVTYSMLLRTP